MKITKSQLKQIIKEELEAILEEDDLDEITSRTKALARMRGVPHMGSGPLPKPEVPESPETEEESAPQSDGDKRRREMEIKMGLPPGTIKSGEELKQAEKARIAKQAAKPKKKASPAPRPEKPYGGGSRNRPWYEGT